MRYKPAPRDEKSRNEVFADSETRAIYEATKLQIDLAMKFKKARIRRKMTQDHVAEIMRTKKPAISRLEACSDDVKNFPSLLTLIKFASAIGYELKVILVPIKNIKPLKQTKTIKS
jgi:transcriptional regulator with XRE-family HTH domain